MFIYTLFLKAKRIFNILKYTFYILLYLISAPIYAFNSEAKSNTVLSTEQIILEKETVKNNSNLPTTSKHEINEYYNKALEFLKNREETIKETVKIKKQIEDTQKHLFNFHQLEMTSPILNIDSRPITLTEIENNIATLNGRAKIEEAALQKIQLEQNQIIQEPIKINNNISIITAEIEKIRKKITGISSVNPELTAVSKAQNEMLLAKKAYLMSKSDMESSRQKLIDLQIKNISDKLAFQTRSLSRTKKTIKEWEDTLKARNADIIYEELRQNNETLRQLDSIAAQKINIDFLIKIAERNIVIANKLIDIKAKSNIAEKDLNILNERKDLLNKDFLLTQKRINLIGLTEKTGLILQTKRATLQTNTANPLISIKRSENIINVNLESDEFIQETQKYLPFKDATYHKLDILEKKLTNRENDILTTNTFVLLDSYRKLLEECGTTYNSYLQILNNQISIQKEIDNISKQFRHYINQRLLWTSSTGFYSINQIIISKKAIVWLFSKDNFLKLKDDIKLSIKQKPEVWIVLLVLLLTSIIFQFYLPGLTLRINRFASIPEKDTISRTFAVLVITIIQTFSIPSVIYLIAEYIGSISTVDFYTKALCSGIMTASIIIATTNFIVSICREDGIGKNNFKWPAEICKYCKKYFLLLGTTAAVLIFFISTIQNAPQILNFRSNLGRTVMIILLLTAIFFIITGIKKYRKLITGKINFSSKNSLHNQKEKISWISFFLTGIPLLLIIMTIAGYYYTVYELSKNILYTALFTFIILISYKTLQRVIFISHIQILNRRSKNEQQRVQNSQVLNELKIKIEDSDSVGITEFPTKQASQLIMLIFIIIYIAGLVNIWQNIFPSFTFLNNICMWDSRVINPENGETLIKQITLLNIFQALFIFLITFIIVRNIPAIIEIGILRGKKFHPGTRYAFELISKYFIICIGLFLGLKYIGIGWTQFQYVAAAMTLGLSFGLQDIFANFVSGIIILFERPIRLGDTISVGDSTGIVSKMHIRSTTVTNWDRQEMIIPNKSFLSDKIINWSLSDQTVRLVINIGISYDSESKEAEQLLLEIAKECPEVMDTPPPSVIFSGFGTNSLDFALRAFVNIEHQTTVQHKIRHLINEKFKTAGIKIPYSQRDIHISGKEGPLKVKLTN